MCSQLFALLLLALSLTLVTSTPHSWLRISPHHQTSKSSDEFPKTMDHDNPKTNRHSHTSPGHSQAIIIEQVRQNISDLTNSVRQMEAFQNQVRLDISNLTNEVQQMGDLQNEVRQNISKEMNEVLGHIEDRLEKQDRKIESINWPKKPEYHVQDEKKNWFEAFADCRKRNMDLATFKNKHEFSEVLKEIKGSKHNNSVKYFWLASMNFNKNSDYAWISSSEEDKVLNWCQGEPNKFLNNITNEMENCVQLKHEHRRQCMNDYFCSEKLHYICENRTNGLPTTTDSKTNKTFVIVNNGTQRNWFEALEDCKKKGMRLASIDSEEERQHLKRKLATEAYRNGEFWLSGSDLGKKGHYVWMTTGEPLDHEALRNSSSMNIEQNCVKMYENGDYYKCRCQSTISYICEGQEDN